MGNKMLGIFFFILMITETVVAERKVFHTYEIPWKAGVRKWVDPGYLHQFKIGDAIQFQYPAGEYNVIEVDQKGFENCIAPPSAKVHDSGNDYLTLEAVGKRWFICGIGQHCKDDDVKVEIEVKPPLIIDWEVGDEKGWKPNVNYKSWSEDYRFKTGDSLVFNYEKGKHNVIQVDEAGYKQCTIPPDQSKALTSGHDKFLLKEAGGLWFISGIGKDCENGMKVFINVVEVDGGLKRPALQGGRKLVSTS